MAFLNKYISIIVVLTLFLYFKVSAQDNLQVYLLPGQGSDHRLFDSLMWPTIVDTTIIVYGTPEEGMSMEGFAKSLLPQIDTSRRFALVGVSLGGMICVELNELLKPEFTVIISSAKNSSELPFRYNFQKLIPLYDIFPGFLLTIGARIMQPIIGPDRRKNKDTFKSMLKRKKPLYMKRTVEMIIKWNRRENGARLYHIHGNKDRTIPIKNLSSSYYLVENGSHMMTLTQANAVSDVLAEIILETLDEAN